MSVNWKQGMLKLAGSNAVLAALAAVAGLGAVVAARHYVDGQVRRMEAGAEARYQPTPVVVAGEDLRPGEPLAAASLAMRRMPAGYLPGGVIADSAAAELVGRSLLVPLRRGDPVTRGVLAPQRAASLSAQLSSGYRALTLAVDDISSHAGMLAPGDEVDLYLAQNRGASGARLALLLQRVPVLATGSRMLRPDGSAADAPYGTITLRTSVDDAARIILAQQAGSLAIALRGQGDSAPALLSVRDSHDLMQDAAPAATLQARKTIEVLLGGEGDPQPRRVWLQIGARS
ncbi:MAG: Flp pilus assembly protein CpaB [Steroidobacteraceae bacterium]